MQQRRLPAYTTRYTRRLRLEPIESRHARDLWRKFQDDRIAEWYAGRWTMEQAERVASAMGEAWASDGVSRRIAYHRGTGELIGRGGCTRAVVDNEPCVEVGWAIRDRYLRQGYATEIGREGIIFAFDVLGVSDVIAFTEVHNVASRGVMERLGMRFDREILSEGLIEGREGVHPDAPFALYRIRRNDMPDR